MNDILFKTASPGLAFEESRPQQDFSMLQRHLHQYAELYFLLEGERYYFIEQDTFHIKSGMAVFVNTGQIHKTSAVNGSPGHHRFLVTIQPYILERFFSITDDFSPQQQVEDFCGVTKFSKKDWERTLSIIEILKKELESENKDTNPLIQLLTMELLVIYIRNYKKQEANAKQHENYNRHLHTGIYKTVHDISLYLQNHSSEECSLDELSTQFYISKSYMTRIFKAVTSFTIKEYLTVCRIRKAKQLLIETEYSITEIAELAGFGNIAYFVKVFKMFVQTTPLQYRKQNTILKQ